jgi:hypothetical protein
MASQINRGQAESLIQEFRNQNKASGDNGLKTPDGKHLNGFFLDRASLESILKDPKVAGIHVHLAKHPDFVGKTDNVHTLVFSGSVPNTAADAKAPYTSSGEMYGDVSPCPPWCNS